MSAMRQSYWLVLCLVMLAAQVAAQDFVFETSATRIALSPKGQVLSLLEKPGEKEWLKHTSASGATPFALARLGGRTVASSAIAAHGDVLRVRFGNSGVEADYRFTPRASYIVIELAAVRGPAVDELVFARLPVVRTAHSGGTLNVRWDDRYCVCLMALDQRFEAAPGSKGMLECTAHRDFGIPGHKAALVAVPTSRFLTVVQELEKEFAIPYATIDGQWGKTSDAVRRGYLFVDLTEANVDETIRIAKLGGFGAILIYRGVWSGSCGSYPIHATNYPHGEDGLRSVARQCHAAGLKVGIHTMTSFVSKNDALVRPRPDPRLLKDAETHLTRDLDGNDAVIPVESHEGFAENPSHGNDPGGMDVQIDDEIIRYDAIGKTGKPRLLRCVRGACGTKAAPHRAGAKVRHLTQRFNHYLADLKSPLKDKIAGRLAGVINRCELDMIYFDGGEGSSANGPNWYWLGALQSEFFRRVKRDVLVQGSARNHWTWHFYSRGTCGDYAALAPKQFLDYYKIANMWNHYHDSFLPAELGWWGFLEAAPEHPPTTPDEVAFYAARMLALDTPVSLETRWSALERNGRTEEMLGMLGECEKLRLGGSVTPAMRERLKTGEWHAMRDKDGRWQFHPASYETQRLALPADSNIQGRFMPQPLRFRMQVLPELAPAGDPANIGLLTPRVPLEASLQPLPTAMPGALLHRVVFAKTAGDQDDAFVVGDRNPRAGKLTGRHRNLVRHRALAVCLEVQNPGPNTTAVLNVQLESVAKRFRDHYIDLDFSGERTVILPGPTCERMLPEFRPARSNYSFKHAGYSFDYTRVVALNLRWMRLPANKNLRCRIKRVEALAESDAELRNASLTVNGKAFPIPAALKTGDYAEFWGGNTLRIYDENGVDRQTLQIASPVPFVNDADNRLRIEAETTATVKFTHIALGQQL